MKRWSCSLAVALASLPALVVNAQPARPAEGLVGEWHLQLTGNSAPDSSGQGHDGTLQGDSASSYGWYDQAVDLAGGKYIVVPNSPTLNFGTGSFTLAAWVRMSNTNAALKTVIDNRGSGTGSGYAFGVDKGRNLWLQLNNGRAAADYVSDGTQTLTPNRWHHIAVVVNRSAAPATVSFYIDGLRARTQPTPIADSIHNTDRPFLIGGNKDGAAQRFSDRIDEVLVYNRAIPADELGGLSELMAPGSTHYQPAFWNNNLGRKRSNNCYNYANNKSSNTFAQPGRAAGSQYTELTCKAVHAAAVRDGLEPITDINAGSYKNVVALVVGNGMDYHWYRRDANGRWTHKPGRGDATEVDNAGKVITDPKTADRGFYKDFCGYFRLWSDAVEGTGHEHIN